MPIQININGDIIPSDWGWIYDLFGDEYASPKMVQEALRKADGADVEININSPGGSVFAGAEIYTLIANYKGNVLIRITGLAASAASMIAMASRSEISPVGMLMIHDCSSIAEGNSQELFAEAATLNQIDRAIANAYRSKTGITEEELLSMMDATTWMNADDAVAAGFVDAIMEGNQSTPTVIANKIVASGNSYSIPENIIEKMIEARANVQLEGKDLSADELLQLITSGKNIVLNRAKNPKKGEMEMPLAEFLASNPDAQAEYSVALKNAADEATNNERDRMRGLDSISGSVPADMLHAAKYEDPKDAASLALEVMQAGKAVAAAYMSNATRDVADSGSAQVVPAVCPVVDEGKEEGSAIAENIANFANKGKKQIKFI